MATGRKTGGRKKGTPNKMTATVKEMILGALDDAGGQGYLLQQAQTNPGAFMTLLGKVLPTQLTGKDDAPLNPPVIQIIPYADDPADPPAA